MELILIFFNFFKNKKPTNKQIIKHIKKIRSVYVQTDYRMESMKRLLSWNTEKSIAGVLNRFSVVAQSPYFDEKEKVWLSKELIKKGVLAKKAICNFLLDANEISYVINSLSRLCNKKELLKVLYTSLKHRKPEDYRSSSVKIDIIDAIVYYSDNFIGNEIIPYIDDYSDDVKCKVINVILDKGLMIANDRLVNMLFEDIHSVRVLRQVGFVVATFKIPILLNKKIVSSVLDYFYVKNGILRLILN